MNPASRFALVFFALVTGSAYAQEALKDADLVKFLTDKPVNVVRQRDGAAIRLEFRTDGRYFQNSSGSAGNITSRNNSGKWKLDDAKARYCIDMNDGLDKDSCYGVMPQGDKTVIFYGSTRNPKVWATVKSD